MVMDRDIEVGIENEHENRLLRRKEVFFRLKFDGGSPSRVEARKALVNALRCRPNLLVIDWMRAEFGKREAVGYAKIYEDEDRMREIEREHIIERNFGGVNANDT
ncbi:MAG: hypothetical protein J7I99_05555 [Methanophagales archaeon]|nr:hypothetical protein [Methanophagales archaeon]